MSAITKLLEQCNAHVNGECRTLACKQPNGSFSCPEKQVVAELTTLRAENERLRKVVEAAKAFLLASVEYSRCNGYANWDASVKRERSLLALDEALAALDAPGGEG